MKQMYSILFLIAFVLLARPAQSSPAIHTQPISFSSFQAVKNSSGILLTWGTPQEADNNNFEIQRSTDGIHWTVVVIVLGKGDSATASLYHFTDKSAAGVYYRIRQVASGHQTLYTTALKAATQNRN